MNISILIATLNEEENISRCLTRVFDQCPDAEVLVVDGGSDRTGEIVSGLEERFPRLRYLRNEHDRGKGHATRVGIAALTGDIVVQVDADLQFPPEQIPLLLAPLADGSADVVLGSRFAKSSVRREGSQTFLRHLGNGIVSGLASLLFAHRMTDVMAGFKAWRREVTERIALESDSYSYEVELAVRALSAGYVVTDVPIETMPRAAGTSSVRVVRDGAQVLADIIRLRIRTLFVS